MRDTIASQLVRHDLPGFISMCLQQSFEEALNGIAIASPDWQVLTAKPTLGKKIQQAKSDRPLSPEAVIQMIRKAS